MNGATSLPIRIPALLTLCVAAVLCAGCPFPWNRGDDTAKVTTLFTAGDGLKSALAGVLAEKAEVPVEDIASLTVTITQIELVPADGGEEAADKAESDHILLFGDGATPIRVDLVDLLEVSEVLSSAQIPAGVYNQIKLYISDLELVLAGSDEVITDVHLTANARLFVTQQFEVPEGEPVLIQLSFDGVHLVELGNGAYNLTPQLQVALEVTSAAVYVEGTIVERDATPGILTLQLANGDQVPVTYTGAAVYLPGDPDPVVGSTDDLAAGQQIQVTGTVALDGAVTADTITILPDAEP